MTRIRNLDDLKSGIEEGSEPAWNASEKFSQEIINTNAVETNGFANFQDVAERRFAALASSGKTIPWEDMRQYLEGRIEKNPANRPQAKTFSSYE